MKEVRFLNLNAKKWKEIEGIVDRKEQNTQKDLAKLFIQLTDDLAFSRTYYPKSRTTLYLNQLTQKVHQRIYRNKKQTLGRIKSFWATELPLLYHKRSNQLLYAFLVFVAACFIGVFSSIHDLDFLRFILGDYYVDITVENIKNGDPMAIYKDSDELGMFARIAFNNIRVSFMTFIFGIFTALGTSIILINNGIMLGSFLYFFHTYNKLGVAMLTVWMHGTIEITSIVIAGGAGFIIGNSFIFPGTYKRLHAFKKAVADGVRILLGLIPLFIIAAIIESYLTRHYENLVLNIIVITVSLFFVIWYFIVYPRLIYKRFNHENF